MKKNLLLNSVHDLIRCNTSSVDVLVDATLGNGYDTLFLSTIAKHVYAFDIQEKAIQASKKRLTGITNVSFIHDSHEKILEYVSNFKGVVFNLGYLPGSDKSITTLADTTIKTLEQLLPKLPIGGFVSITVYIGHDQGKLESAAVETYLENLNSNYEILKSTIFNKRSAPYHLFIKKNN
jgi:hypothetical protein